MSTATLYSFENIDGLRERRHCEFLYASDADRIVCQAMIKTGSRSFFAASLLLPERIRAAAYALYGFCRLSDDVVDVESGANGAISRLRKRLDGVYAGQPFDDPADRCLADVVNRFGIPRAMFDALMEGFEWDVSERAYQTLDDVEAYGERVAGSVGGMMAALMDARSPDMVERACDLGVAMQLTNIARDIGEDARNGRLYLPRHWFDELGLDPQAWLRAPVFGPEIAEMTRRLLARADALYRRADQAIARLPAVVRPAIYAARLLYAEIGVIVAKNKYNSVDVRARTSATRKAWLVGSAMQRATKPAPKSLLTLQDGMNRALVAAVVNHPAPPPVLTKPAPTMQDDINFVLDLFTDLEQRDRMERSR